MSNTNRNGYTSLFGWINDENNNNEQQIINYITNNLIQTYSSTLTFTVEDVGTYPINYFITKIGNVVTLYLHGFTFHNTLLGNTFCYFEGGQIPSQFMPSTDVSVNMQIFSTGLVIATTGIFLITTPHTTRGDFVPYWTSAGLWSPNGILDPHGWNYQSITYNTA